MVNNKSLSSAFLTVILICGLILVSAIRFDTVQASTGASGIPKPSVPEFTLKLVDHSYDVPQSYSIDPYTGKSVMTEEGYHVENKSIEVTIKNQPFTNYKDAKGNTLMLYYDIRWKGHFEDHWRSFNSTNQMYLVASSSLMADNVLVYPNSPSTVLSYGLGGNNGSDVYSERLDEISAGGQVDFQVEALIGYYTKVYDTPVPGIPGSQHPYHYEFTGESSGWSETQTITIGESQTPTPSPEAMPTPSEETQQTEQIEAIVGVVIVVAVIVFGLSLLIYLIKRK